jgi:hypothetical protein
MENNFTSPNSEYMQGAKAHIKTSYIRETLCDIGLNQKQGVWNGYNAWQPNC